MHNRMIMILIFCLITAGVSAQTVGENFEAGGVVVSLSGYYFNNLVDEDEGDREWELKVSPNFSVFVVDSLALEAGAFLHLEEKYDEFNYLTVKFGASYSFVSDSYRQAGLVPSLGADAYIYTGAYDQLSGYQIIPFFKLMAFVQPRVAPFIRLEAIRLNFDDDRRFPDEPYLNLEFGIGFHFPNKELSLF